MKWSTRKQWHARRPRGVRTDINPVGVAVHWYGGGSFKRQSHNGCLSLVRAAQDQHMKIANVNDIYYNLAVCHHGYVIEARSTRDRPRVRGGANGTAASNGSWYSVLCLWGAGDGHPTDALLNTARDAIDFLRQHAGAGDRLSGHRDHVGTTCPGDDLYQWAHDGAPRPDEEADLPSPKDVWSYKTANIRLTDDMQREDQGEKTMAWFIRDIEATTDLTRRKVDQLIAEVAAQQATIDKLVDLLGSDGAIDVEAVKAELRDTIREAVESIDIDVTTEGD